MIPKVFHNIWIGGKLPDKHKWLIDSNRKGHEFIVAHKKLPCYIR